MSPRRTPLCLAATRACWSSIPNSRLSGGCKTLRITTSRSPSTTNRAPGLSPRRVRISSGITTCPLEERVVVVASLMNVSDGLTSKIGTTSLLGKRLLWHVSAVWRGRRCTISASLRCERTQIPISSRGWRRRGVRIPLEATATDALLGVIGPASLSSPPDSDRTEQTQNYYSIVELAGTLDRKSTRIQRRCHQVAFGGYTGTVVSRAPVPLCVLEAPNAARNASRPGQGY